MKKIEEIEEVKFGLAKVKADLEIYNTDYMKDKWVDKACDEFVLKIQNVYKIIDELNEELEQLKTYWVNYRDGE